MSDHILFLKSFLRRPTQIGSVWPSSRGLSEMLVDSCDWNTAKYVVEFGPGTGVATEVIMRRLKPDIRFFAIERSHELAQKTRQRCPGADIVEGCVTEIEEYCRQRDMPRVDAIISGLPWASFSSELQDSIFEAMFRVLPKGGQFATFAYLQGLLLPAGGRFFKLLKKNFSEVKKSPVVWKNVPPAFVYRCIR
jgi:phosphatidylethanolamine/phosphatidyl-N-methylethanolamine N-methyltransferase